MKFVEIVNLDIHGDHRGSLISLEENSMVVPFDIKRVYYIFDTKDDVIRGKHAHKELEQLVIAINGKCNFYVDNGFEKQTIKIDGPSKAIHIKGLVWREMMDFSEDCVLMVLASEHYNTADYIYDYHEFLDEVGKGIK
ncbi:FdtA/QdtA family cupin domain-containing protein [Paenibacillus illinoisensis]|uniref:sugar 3,4-ketoisomerase n=1 Tax=Paenibacillus illinoisensis TaxID=59845 RepID=UPI001C8E21F7|nr:FdtA/QdtA family cupin domain-containing protein [Paenibacillus illinoisensis]MBY0220372.1 WxcM-like domain-containing protein [Paenibacillus illinoisensis]